MYSLYSNLFHNSGLSVKQLESVLKKTGLEGLGHAFKLMEEEYKVDALILIAFAFAESGRGWSYLTTHRNNIFGVIDFGLDPYQPKIYATKSESIEDFVQILLRDYLDPKGFAYSSSTTIKDIFGHYATRHELDALNIVAICNSLEKDIAEEQNLIQKVLHRLHPDIDATKDKYIFYPIQLGDTLSSIAKHFHIHDSGMLYELNKNILNQEARNNGRDENDPNILFAGTIVKVPVESYLTIRERQTFTQKDPKSNELWVVIPASYPGYLEVIANKYGTSSEQILTWNKAKYPKLTLNYVQPGWTIRVK